MTEKFKMYVRRGVLDNNYVCKERGGVLRDISILKIEAKTVNMYSPGLP